MVDEFLHCPTMFWQVDVESGKSLRPRFQPPAILLTQPQHCSEERTWNPYKSIVAITK